MYIIYGCDLDKICNVSPFDVFLALISAAAHDMDHPGNKNDLECKN